MESEIMEKENRNKGWGGRRINKIILQLKIKIHRKDETSISIDELILNAQQNQKSYHHQLIYIF